MRRYGLLSTYETTRLEVRRARMFMLKLAVLFVLVLIGVAFAIQNLPKGGPSNP